ncbi:hypothetical protein [Streptomyces triculaminicus]|uniref:hypothetical protein n=1 Tax=Streptomyces triculaminicus TaxID=2816232 RepID=UPI0037D07D78
MHPKDRDAMPTAEHEPNQPRQNTCSRTTASPAATGWRAFLRADELPEELKALPLRQRRRAKKAWRSARRDQRGQWAKKERRRVPDYGPLVPVLAMLIAAVVTVGAWLYPDDRDDSRPKASPSATASPSSTTKTLPPRPVHPRPTPSGTPATTPEEVAQAFLSAYCSRRPRQDGTHTGAVERAAPYASQPLTDNLERHGDKDFDRLVAAQALEAKATKVELSQPTSTQRPGPDTPVRVYRQAKVTVEAKGTDTYTYVRVLTVEVQRAETDQAWMVTRLLGVEE